MWLWRSERQIFTLVRLRGLMSLGMHERADGTACRGDDELRIPWCSNSITRHRLAWSFATTHLDHSMQIQLGLCPVAFLGEW